MMSLHSNVTRHAEMNSGFALKLCLMGYINALTKRDSVLIYSSLNLQWNTRRLAECSCCSFTIKWWNKAQEVLLNICLCVCVLMRVDDEWWWTTVQAGTHDTTLAQIFRTFWKSRQILENHVVYEHMTFFASDCDSIQLEEIKHVWYFELIYVWVCCQRLLVCDSQSSSVWRSVFQCKHWSQWVC